MFNVGLERKGPGLLLRDILAGDRQVERVAEIIRAADPDVILLLDFDRDAEARALSAFRDFLAQGGGGTRAYAHIFSPPQNAGVDSGLDLNGDGLLRGAADAFGFGEFRGSGAMALLSRLPIENVRDFAGVLWADLPGADLPENPDGTPFPTAEAQRAMRLSSHGHWDVALRLPDGRVLHVLASNSSPPVFDGAEDMNGKRNRDELLFWDQYLSGTEFSDRQGRIAAFEGGPYVLLAGLNTDPADGAGARDLFNDLLARGVFADPQPASRGGVDAARAQGGANLDQTGDPAQDTADWRDDIPPGNLRVDYVLPSQALRFLDSGVVWPADGEPLFEAVTEAQELGTRHRLVWVDLD